MCVMTPEGIAMIRCAQLSADDRAVFMAAFQWAVRDAADGDDVEAAVWELRRPSVPPAAEAGYLEGLAADRARRDPAAALLASASRWRNDHRRPRGLVGAQ